MSDKLQAIKQDYSEFLELNPNAALMNVFVSDYVWLIEQLEQARQKNHNMWECPVCGFAFDAIHTDDKTGEYSCPACAEIELEKKLEQALEKIKQLKKSNHLLQVLHGENYAKSNERQGIIEELKAANQKLVECLELLKTWDLNWLNKANVRKIVDDVLQGVQHGTSKG